MNPLVHCKRLAMLLALVLAASAAAAQTPPAAGSQSSTSQAGPALPGNMPPILQQLAAGLSAMAAPATATAPGQKHMMPLMLRQVPGATPPGPDAPDPSSRSADESGVSSSLHLIVGRSLYLEFPQRLRRVYVSNPEALDAVTATPSELVITAKTAGTSSLVLWTSASQPEMYTVLCDVDVAGLRESLAEALPGDHVEVEGQQGRIHLTGVVDSDAAADEATRLASVYAKDVINSLVVDPRHLPQVELQVRIAELDRSKLTAFGINLLGLNPNNMGQGTTEQFSPFTFQNNGSTLQALTSDFLNLFYFNLKNGVGATIKDLQTKGILEILAEPNLTTIHGQPARFLAGGEFPYPIVQPGGVGSVPTITIQFRPYGVKLEFTPFVNSDGTIRLRVAPEVSALDYTNQVVIAGYALPALSTRRAETEVELKDGQSFGISGILDHRITDTLSKMPGIGDIPILGQLFRSKNLNHSTMELVVIVTPRIIDTLGSPGPAVPATPAMPVPFLGAQPFDQSLPASEKK